MSDTQAELDQLAADLARDAQHTYEAKREEQQEFLNDLGESDGEDLLETTCSITGESDTHTVAVSAKLNGDLMDAVGRIDARMERLENEDARAYEVSETADEAAQLLADVTEDPSLHKRAFYEQYEEHGLPPLATVITSVMESLEAERERQEGAAEGFRPT